MGLLHYSLNHQGLTRSLNQSCLVLDQNFCCKQKYEVGYLQKVLGRICLRHQFLKYVRSELDLEKDLRRGIYLVGSGETHRCNVLLRIEEFLGVYN